MTPHPIVVGIFQSGQKLWTDRPTLPTLKSHPASITTALLPVKGYVCLCRGSQVSPTHSTILYILYFIKYECAVSTVVLKLINKRSHSCYCACTHTHTHTHTHKQVYVGVFQCLRQGSNKNAAISADAAGIPLHPRLSAARKAPALISPPPTGES